MPTQEFTTEELATEIWKPVVGYEAFYAVSSLGRVKRIAGGKGIVKNKILKNRPAKGYARVSLCVNGKAKDKDVHTLVAHAFIGPRPSGYEINHIDRDPGNPRAANLEYVTPLQNMRHSLEQVRAKRLRIPGIHHWATLRPEQVRRVIVLRSEGRSANKIAAIMSISQRAVINIINGSSWKRISTRQSEHLEFDN